MSVLSFSGSVDAMMANKSDNGNMRKVFLKSI